MSKLTRPTMPVNYEAQLAALPAVCRIATDYVTTGINQHLFLIVDQLLPAVTALDSNGWYLEDITGMHVADGFLLRYHFSRWDDSWRICLRLTVNAEQPSVPSIVQAISGAEWHERETTDFYGIAFIGNPNSTPLLLAADQVGLAPLRKEIAALKAATNMLPDFQILSGPSDHPLRALLTDRARAAKEKISQNNKIKATPV
ncbi:hypothetical protein DSUL_60029 [Desulfovibrionales bacterium]